jgi:hypothetical protein
MGTTERTLWSYLEALKKCWKNRRTWESDELWIPMREYGRGFEDAVELALRSLEDSGSLEEAQRRVRRLLGLVKERKFEALREMLEGER